MSKNPNDVQDSIKLHTCELGPALAEKAKANGRSLSKEIRERLRESLRQEGVDVDQLLVDWLRDRKPILVLAGEYYEASRWAYDRHETNWHFVRGIECLDDVSHRYYVVLDGFAARPDAGQLMRIIKEAPHMLQIK